ncbi:diacylglycerol O-acyltransferase 1-like isoform X2 [Clupea harengus]|uniref:diacylglycerol O-acyltransferase n=1 Tax=Clupea harengus TaxID=7950 RepID=A0A6P8F7Y2_CLUHA|nr:diacylglycerol O-acyltransferase 1-like isoform X2 [Clupea harengus]
MVEFLFPLPELYYFLLAPTLCYQRDFPQTPRVRINFILQSLVEMVILTQLIVGIMQQWIDPIFQRSKKSFADMEIAARIEHLVELATPTHFLWLMFFFLFSHSYLNILAELLRFGDRHFYGDWWNADTLGSFWRNWNVPFQKWIQRHLYEPFLKKKFSTKQADILIFIVVSALLEFNIALALQRCHLWLFLNMMFELLLAFLLDRFFIGNYGNGLVWFCLLLGPPLAVTTYYHDHYMSQRGPSDDFQSVQLQQEKHTKMH